MTCHEISCWTHELGTRGQCRRAANLHESAALAQEAQGLGDVVVMAQAVQHHLVRDQLDVGSSWGFTLGFLVNHGYNNGILVDNNG